MWIWIINTNIKNHFLPHYFFNAQTRLIWIGTYLYQANQINMTWRLKSLPKALEISRIQLQNHCLQFHFLSSPISLFFHQWLSDIIHKCKYFIRFICKTTDVWKHMCKIVYTCACKSLCSCMSLSPFTGVISFSMCECVRAIKEQEIS